jgi:tight adherence protein B
VLIVAILSFVAIFAITALAFSLFGSDAAEEQKQTVARLAEMTMARTATEDAPVDLRKHESTSSIPFLNRLLLRANITPKLRGFLSQANVKWTPARLLLMAMACGFIPGMLVQMRTGVAVLSLITALLSGAIPFIYVFLKRSKRFDRFEQGLPAALDLMASGLRSGHSLISAMNLVSREAPDPIGPEFRLCFDEQNYGLELRNAMQNLAQRVPLQDVRIVITAILIQKETGGNLAEVLDKCSHVIRERFRLKKEIGIRTAQGRLTGSILTLLPVILGFLMYLVNPEHISLLWKHPLGIKMLYVSGGMTTVGGLIIRKIVRIRV